VRTASIIGVMILSTEAVHNSEMSVYFYETTGVISQKAVIGTLAALGT
jgi:hypothetical protein